MSDNIVILAERRPKVDDTVPPRDPLLEIVVFANGDETLWVADGLQTAVQFNWAISQVAECLGALLRLKGERAGTR